MWKGIINYEKVTAIINQLLELYFTETMESASALRPSQTLI